MGALDSILDVVGVCVALEVLGIDTIVCSPIAVGHGTVRTAHGELPNPVPAVTALLARAGRSDGRHRHDDGDRHTDRRGPDDRAGRAASERSRR